MNPYLKKLKYIINTSQKIKFNFADLIYLYFLYNQLKNINFFIKKFHNNDYLGVHPF